MPLVGSVTPNACSRSSPLAIFGQPFRLLLVAAVPQHRAHGVHLGVAGAAVAAGALDLLEDRGRGRQRQPGAAIFLGDQHREIAGLGQRVDELGRIGPLAVELAPVFAGELGAELGDRVADVGMFVLLFVCGHRNSAGRSRARIVAVQNAQRRFGRLLLGENFDGGNTDRARHFQGFGARDELVAVGGARKLTLISTVTPILALRQPRGNRDPGGMVGQRRDDPAVEMAEELHEIVAARQRDLGVSRLDLDDAEAGGAGKALGVDRRGEPRWIELGRVHAGMRTGRDSMPRTKLE